MTGLDLTGLPPEVIAQLSRRARGVQAKTRILRVGRQKPSARSLAIADAYRSGEKLEAIAALFGISRQRVEQIARRAGIAKRCPWKRPKPETQL